MPRTRLFLRSFCIALCVCLSAVALLWGCAVAWEGMQAVAADSAPAVTPLAGGGWRVLDWVLFS